MKKLRILVLIFIVFTFSHCNIGEQLSQMANFTKCQFRIGTVNNITLAGVNVQKIQNYNQINTMDVIKY
ncbi:MAG: hypothetical protein WCH34_12565 [Bacteroidota bacterium]